MDFNLATSYQTDSLNTSSSCRRGTWCAEAARPFRAALTAYLPGLGCASLHQRVIAPLTSTGLSPVEARLLSQLRQTTAPLSMPHCLDKSCHNKLKGQDSFVSSIESNWRAVHLLSLGQQMILSEMFPSEKVGSLTISHTQKNRSTI